MTDLQKINDSGQLDLNFSVDGEEKAEGYVQLDLNMQAKGSPQVPSDFGSQNPVSSYYKSHSVETELDQDNTRRTKIDYDQEKTQSPCSEHDCVRTQSPNQGEMVEFSGSYFDKCSPDFRAQTVHHERGTEGSAPSQESPLPEDNNQKEETECNSNIDPPYTSARVEKVKGARFENSNYEFKKSSVNDIEGEDIEHQAGILSSHSRSPSVDGAIEQIEDYNSLRDSPAEGRDLDMPHSVSQCDGRTCQHSTSPVAVKSMLVSPFASPLSTPEGVQERLHSTSPLRQKDPYSPKPSDVAKRTSRCDNLSPSATRTRTSRRDNLSPSATRTRTSPKRSRRTRGSPVKRLSASPEPHRLPQRYERNNRQMSRSPIRRRDPTSGYGRDYHDRYRSRSPHARDHYRSQRQRYSPRRRSPGYHSRRHSPRRRPWSPPPNRRTGLGIPGKDIFVAGFSFLTTERDLERKFSRFGRVRDVRIVRDKRSGDSRGFGFMSMEKDEEADAAIRALDETEWNGRIILVEKSKSTG